MCWVIWRYLCRSLVPGLTVVIFVLLARPAAAQSPSANSITGVVVDPTGAILPNAQIEVKTTTGVAAQTTSNSAGAFQIDRLPRGSYDIVVTFEGFQTTTVRAVIGARAPGALRIVMPLAGVKQEITVSNAAAEIKTDACRVQKPHFAFWTHCTT